MFGVPTRTLGFAILLIANNDSCHIAIKYFRGEPGDVSEYHGFRSREWRCDSVKDPGVGQSSHCGYREVGASRPGDRTILGQGKPSGFFQPAKLV